MCLRWWCVLLSVTGDSIVSIGLSPRPLLLKMLSMWLSLSALVRLMFARFRIYVLTVYRLMIRLEVLSVC